MATIDKNSITATKTNDPAVFTIGFDFTDDTVVDPNTAWLYKWNHAEFTYNTNMTDAEFNTAATAAMARARKPSSETSLETALKSKFGIVVVRADPNVTPLPVSVKISEVDSTVVMKTQAV